MPTKTFYDLKTRKKFTTDKYVFKTKKNTKTGRTTYFIVADAPSGIKSWLIVSKDFYIENK